LGDKGAPSLPYLLVLGAKLALVAAMLSLAWPRSLRARLTFVFVGAGGSSARIRPIGARR
jgi:hypothetical protein